VKALASDAEAARVAREIGYPVMLKAVMGGAARACGWCVARTTWLEALRAARAEAGAAFGDAAVYLERAVAERGTSRSRCSADTHDNVIHLGERECSIQRRHQKLIEECPSPLVDAPLRAHGEAACRLARAAGYVKRAPSSSSWTPSATSTSSNEHAASRSSTR